MRLDANKCAHLVLVNNPAHQPQGDFGLSGSDVTDVAEQRLTFSGIGVYHPRLFDGIPDEVFPLAPLLRAAITRGEVSGEHYTGRWLDIGTPQRLDMLNHALKG
jgi:MurNAc alpha-1-phosphate uridylyltransferase